MFRYDPKMLTACGIAVIGLLIACGPEPAKPTASLQTSELPACRAASASMEYGNLLPIPDETKSLIESYRSDWKDFCDTAKQSGKPTMADLVVKAHGIVQQFDKTFETYYKTTQTPERDK